MRFDYRIVFIITGLLFTLSTSLTIINYTESMDSTRKQLKNSSLPLTVENIYTTIQKQIIEPNLIASVMSNDTFVIDWLAHEEADTDKIIHFLKNIQNKYQLFVTFLVSANSKNYYSNSGLLEQIAPDNPNSDWYFEFMARPYDSEINIDHNQYMGQELIMFINHKIYNNDGKTLGATGVALKTAYINDMLKYFRERYQFNVFFINKAGKVLIEEKRKNNQSANNDHPELQKLVPEIITIQHQKEPQLFEYNKTGEQHLLTTKYIEELDLYLIVEAKVDNFTTLVKEALYYNIVISLLVTLIITVVVLLYVRKIHGKLHNLAANDSLTGLPNRRNFYSKLEQLTAHKNNAQKNRLQQELSLIFFDVDDFKEVNDAQGHDVGDKVLIEIAATLTATIKHPNLVARWGGEEFIIMLPNTTLTDAQNIAEQLRGNIEQSELLLASAKKQVTVSVGVTEVNRNDNADTIFKRVDNALYQAKRSGKNQVVTS